MELSELGALIRDARVRSGLSQADLARMSELSRATINYAERGRVAIGADALLTLMSLLGLGIEPIPNSDHALRLLA